MYVSALSPQASGTEYMPRGFPHCLWPCPLCGSTLIVTAAALLQLQLSQQCVTGSTSALPR